MYVFRFITIVMRPILFFVKTVETAISKIEILN